MPVRWEDGTSVEQLLFKLKGTIELGCYPLRLKQRPKDTGTDAERIAESVMGEPGGGDGRPGSSVKKYEQLLKDNLKGIKMVADEKERWHILSKELSQKQELIHRLKKEYDEKSENLKIIGSEITELRRELKMELSENALLKKRLAQEEKLEIDKMVTKEMMAMSPEELRTKLVKVSQAYKEERNRNEEFERAIKAAHRDMVEVRKTQKKFEELEKIHTEKSRRLLAMQQDLRKINLYADTIKKQEKVIVQLEHLIEKTMKETEKASRQAVEFEKIKTENIKLQEMFKKKVYGKKENEEVERLREEVRKLERIKRDLEEELKYKRPQSSGGHNLKQQTVELEVQVQRAQARVESLQSQLNKNSKRQAEEIAQLQTVLQERTATLDAYNYKGM